METRKNRKLKKYKPNFNIMFSFFLDIYRKQICTFCGSIVKVDFDINEIEGKFCFRKLENGDYTLGKIPVTRHPNIVKAVITGKKSWGLWVNEWSDGIVEWSFTLDEILNEFKNKNIIIPEELLQDFKNRINHKKHLRNLNYLKSLEKI